MAHGNRFTTEHSVMGDEILVVSFKDAHMNLFGVHPNTVYNDICSIFFWWERLYQEIGICPFL